MGLTQLEGAGDARREELWKRDSGTPLLLLLPLEERGEGVFYL